MNQLNHNLTAHVSSGVKAFFDGNATDQIVNSIKGLSQGSSLYMNIYSLNRKKISPERDTIYWSVLEACRRGVNVEINGSVKDPLNRQNLDSLERAGAKVVRFNRGSTLHAKTFMGWDSKKLQGFLYSGSTNPTHRAATANKEEMVRSTDENLIKAEMERFKKLSASADGKNRVDHSCLPLIPITPPKARVVSSWEHNINASRVERIKSDHDYYISSMTWNGLLMTERLVKEGQRGSQVHVLVDQTALSTQAAIDQLKRIQESGKENTSVSVYNNRESTQHRKHFLRLGQKPLVVVSTGNHTPTGNRDYNQDFYIPGDRILASYVRAHQRKLKSTSVSLNDFLGSAKKADNLKKRKAPSSSIEISNLKKKTKSQQV